MSTDTSPQTFNFSELLALIPRPVPWDQFKAEVLPSLSRPACSASHEKKVTQVIGELEALDPPIVTTADLTVAMLSRYVAARPKEWSPYTLKSHLQVVSTLCKMAFDRRYLVISPFTSMPMRRLVRLRPLAGKRHLTRDEITRLLAVLRDDIATKKGWALWKARRLYAVVNVGLYCGLRRNELLTLHVADLDIPARVIRLTPHTKSGRLKTEGSAKPVGIPDVLVPVLEDWLAHRLDAPRGFRMPRAVPWMFPTCNRKAPWLSGSHGSKAIDMLQSAGSRAGIERTTMHMLRRSLATHLEGHGIGGAMISRILRHSSQQVTETFYRQADEKQIAEAVKDLVF